MPFYGDDCINIIVASPDFSKKLLYLYVLHTAANLFVESLVFLSKPTLYI